MAHDFDKGLKPTKAPVQSIKKSVQNAGEKSYSSHASLAGTGKPNKKNI